MVDDPNKRKEATQDREVILLRRRRFVVTALSGVALGLEACKESSSPSSDPQPSVCLKIAQPDPPPPSSPAPSSTPPPGSSPSAPASSPPEPPDAGAPDASKPIPRPCLKVRPRID